MTQMMTLRNLNNRLSEYLSAHPEDSDLEICANPECYGSGFVNLALWDANGEPIGPWDDLALRLSFPAETPLSNRFHLGPYSPIRSRAIPFAGEACMYFTYRDDEVISLDSSKLEQLWYGYPLATPICPDGDLPLLTLRVSIKDSTARAYFGRFCVENGVITTESQEEAVRASADQAMRQIANRGKRRKRDRRDPSKAEVHQWASWPENWMEQVRPSLFDAKAEIVDKGIGGPLLLALLMGAEVKCGSHMLMANESRYTNSDFAA